MKQNELGKAGIATLLFAATFTVMVGSLITPALPAIALQLGYAAAPGWLVTLPALGVVLFGPLAGRIIDRLGARKAMIIGLVLYGAFGEGVVALTFSRIAVLGDRLLLGAATALVMAAGTTLIADFFDGSQRLKMIVWQGMAIEAGGVVFLALGGILGGWAWRMPFLLYLLSWLCLLCVCVFIPQPTPAADTESAETTQSSNLFPIFLNAFLAMTIFFVAYITLPSTLAVRLELTEAQTGYFMAFISVAAVLFAGCLPRLTKIIPAKLLLSSSFLFFGVGELLFAHAAHMPGMVLGAVITGAGFAFSIPTANHLVIEEGAAHMRGKNLSYLSMAIFLGQFASSFVTLGGLTADQELSCAGLASLGIGVVGVLIAWAKYGGSRKAAVTVTS